MSKQEKPNEPKNILRTSSSNFEIAGKPIDENASDKSNKLFQSAFLVNLLPICGLLFSFRHIQLSIKFATTAGFDVLTHHLIYYACEYFGINHWVCVLLDSLLIIVILVCSVEMIFELLCETKKIVLSFFGKKSEF